MPAHSLEIWEPGPNSAWVRADQIGATALLNLLSTNFESNHKAKYKPASDISDIFSQISVRLRSVFVGRLAVSLAVSVQSLENLRAPLVGLDVSTDATSVRLGLGEWYTRESIQ